MKLDEKIIAYFESSNTPVDKEGYLYKKGEIKTSYLRRWFVLKGNLLFYKDRPCDRDLTGVIVLEGCTVQLCVSEEQFAFSLEWSEPGLRTYKFATEDQESQESWIKALQSANHSYLSLLLVEMEARYRDSLSQFCGEPAKAFVMPNFDTAAAGYPVASSSASSAQPSALSSFPAPGAGVASALGPNLIVPSHVPSVAKRSPKLRSRRNANVVAVNSFSLQLDEWSWVSFGSKEEFSQLHDDFGKEVKKLIADWSKRRRGEEFVEGENLIDLG